MMVFGNTGFIGFPVTAAVFGAEALIYTTVFNLAFNALVFTLGVWMLATDNKYGVKIKMSPKSVSYTHLDVYKRQTMMFLCPSAKSPVMEYWAWFVSWYSSTMM